MALRKERHSIMSICIQYVFSKFSTETRWQISQHRITDTVLVVNFGANFRYVFVRISQNRRERFEKVLMKNIEMVKVSPKYCIVHRVLKN